MRGLNETFIKDLQNGELAIFLDKVKKDDTLCLEIRENYINIYYRGGSMFRIEQYKEKYKILFDLNYCTNRTHSKYLSNISKIETHAEWAESIPLLKAEMDSYFFEHPKHEREYQQLVLRANNNNIIAKDTDYYFVDMEYANSLNRSRFDLVAIKWLSESITRRNADNINLAFIEMKYGDGALSGEAGIQKHIQDLNKFMSDSSNIDAIQEEMETVFNQKIRLGLIPSVSKEIKINKNTKSEFILLIANHKPAKSVLKREISLAMNTIEYKELVKKCDLKIATASFMGYGLYNNCMRNIEDFLDEL